jgi:hypothetical protein
MELSILYFIVPTVVIVSIVIQLCSRRKDKYQRLMRSLFYRPPLPGARGWGLGPWYYGAWDVGEKLNESIAAGQACSSHQRYYRRSHRRKPPHKQH